MAQLHELQPSALANPALTSYAPLIPGVIQRLFYIYEAGQTPWAGHRHRRAWHALICLKGHCRVYVKNGREATVFQLANPRQCLVLKPEDWHMMDEFSKDSILLVLANESYDKDDHIYKPYPVRLRKEFVHTEICLPE